jgi:hypothetical protein
MSVTKAYIALVPPNSGTPELGRVTFMYNPKEFSFKKAAQWGRKPSRGAKSAALPEFQGAEPTTLSVEVFLDGYESGRDISHDIDTLTRCCTPLPDTLSDNLPSPPWVMFGWGSTVHLTAFVRSVDVKCTMFSSEGRPLRALCTVTMEEIAVDKASQNPTSGARQIVRSHVVVAGDSLPSIAFRHYGSAATWRALASFNDIDNPLRLPVGHRLLVPDLGMSEEDDI